ncbi:MAG: hypothetical protein GF317_14825 [Candidatus Lokiarchaeota archaeon]|nr:hypothetical protein [Candidatus Lokiarchaeota archaeon]MBD3200876.1 hypothetical protein [Candidatus Lokiarchaeota archaeon]
MEISFHYSQKIWGFYTNGTLIRIQVNEKITKTNSTISITVKFFANLRDYGPKKEKIEVPLGTQFKDLLRKYEIPKEIENFVILVNGRPKREENFPVKDGDTVAIFPMIAGG